MTHNPAIERSLTIKGVPVSFRPTYAAMEGYTEELKLPLYALMVPESLRPAQVVAILHHCYLATNPSAPQLGRAVLGEGLREHGFMSLAINRLVTDLVFHGAQGHFPARNEEGDILPEIEQEPPFKEAPAEDAGAVAQA